MAKNKKPKRNLYKEAFINQYNLILLSFAVVMAVTTGIAGGAFYLPIIAALGLEMLYLGFVPETKIFQRMVDQKYLAMDEEEIALKLQRRLDNLTFEQRARHDGLSGIIENTKQNLNRQGAGLGDAMIDKLETLKERFLWMMETANSYNRYLANIDHDRLKKDLHHVQATMATAKKGRIKKSLEERHSILSKRLERLERVYENRTVVTTQIATVEDIMRLIYESSMSMTDPRGISQQVDDLLIDVESTEETVFELDQVEAIDEKDVAFDAELEKAIEDAEIELEFVEDEVEIPS